MSAMSHPQPANAAPPPLPGDPARIGLAGRLIIWALALLLYGGGLGAWFYAVDTVQAMVSGTLRPPPAPYEASTNSWWTDLTNMVSGEDDSNSPPAEVEAASAPEAGGGQSAPGVAPGAAPAATDWPRIRVMGSMIQGGQRVAILGNDVVPVGSTHAGLRVVSIEDKRLTLEYRGQAKVFYFGTVTQ
jgi:hypothetical protein